jgi:hypothetical protein
LKVEQGGSLSAHAASLLREILPEAQSIRTNAPSCPFNDF